MANPPTVCNVKGKGLSMKYRSLQLEPNEVLWNVFGSNANDGLNPFFHLVLVLTFVLWQFFGVCRSAVPMSISSSTR